MVWNAKADLGDANAGRTARVLHLRRKTIVVSDASQRVRAVLDEATVRWVLQALGNAV